MTLYPEAQRRAQQEIDAITKPGCLPTFEDAETYPYITAMVHEVLRWNPNIPLGEYELMTQLLGVYYTALTSTLFITDYT
jgi:cytochrome P450